MALGVMPSKSASAVAEVACDMASLVFMDKDFSTLKEISAIPHSTLKYSGGLIPAMTLAERIAEAIGDRPQAEIARAVKKSESAVTQWLDGTTKSLKADSAARLEAVTGYRASWIVTGKGPKLLDRAFLRPGIGGVRIL